MTLVVNGEEREVADGVVVAELLQSLGLPAERLAVELNRRIMRRVEWASTVLAPGDRVEIVQFVGGGE